MTVVREVREETALEARVTGLAYVAESFDAATETQFTASASRSTPRASRAFRPRTRTCAPCRWVPRAELASLLTVRVVREPLLGYLADPAQRYFGYLEAGITIAFGDEPA